MEKLLKTDIEFIQEKLEYWALKPNIFVREIYGVTPEIWQDEVLEAFPYENRISVRSGHGVGKTALESWLIPLFLATRTPAKIVATANSSSQLFDILWAELAIWRRKSKYGFGDLFKLSSDNFHLIGAEKENFATARTSRRDQPEALQGAHSANMMFLIDEASGIPEIIFETASGSLSTEGSKIIMFSNPTRTSGYFFNSFHKNRAQWWTRKVSCHESTQVRKGYIEEMAETYGIESNIYKVRVLGDFPESSDDAVINLKMIEDAVDRGVEGFGDIVWGVDVARYGSARSALCKRHGPKVIRQMINEKELGVRTWSMKDTMITAGIIKKEWDETPEKERPIKIVVDVIGLGAGVADRLLELELPVVPLNVAETPSESQKYLRLRDELWFTAREWFQNRTCDIPDDEVLISELSGPLYTINSNGKIIVESKDDMKKRGLESPDAADAFIMTFATEMPRKKKNAFKKTNYNRPSSWMAV